MRAYRRYDPSLANCRQETYPPETKTRLIALFTAATLAAPAVADDASFDGYKAAAAYLDFLAACQQHEFKGQPITPAQSVPFCTAQGALYFQLRTNGWCWNQDKYEWVAPNTTSDTGFHCPSKN